jgi:glutamate N-acetyltransferase/amino-acid N-acetyltransferase
MNWPRGAISSGVASGIKEQGLDLGMLVFESPCAWAGTFTRNAAAAACVRWSRSLLSQRIRAVVVNSGNANACTGKRGPLAVEETTRTAAGLLSCSSEEILVASTGPIGIPLPVEKLVGAMPAAVETLSRSTNSFSEAILTTDSAPKVAAIEAGGASLVGVGKGAAMLAPDMATMLAFIVTDAQVDGRSLRESLHGAVNQTFNRLSVDACESTNDSVFAIATGTAEPVSSAAFADALRQVCWHLAEQMARDAEGGTRLVRIRIGGAQDDSTAATLGHAVAASALWRAALHGSDPNWGRVLAALGTVDRTLDLNDIEIRIGRETVFECGEPSGSLTAAAEELARSDVAVSCRVGHGRGTAELLSSDLSPDYVTLNSKGTT